MRRLFLTSAAAAGFLFVGANANATLTITAGSLTASSPTNNFATVTGATGSGWNLNNVFVTGVDSFGGNGEIFDLSNFNLSNGGNAPDLTVTVTETGLTTTSGLSFSGNFSAADFTSITATRSFYFDPTNAGLTTTLLGSTTSTGGTFTASEAFTGTYSITEVIVVHATGKGANLSSDDALKVPEPISLTLLGSGLLGLGLVRRRRR